MSDETPIGKHTPEAIRKMEIEELSEGGLTIYRLLAGKHVALAGMDHKPFADEISRRWNAFPDLLAACREVLDDILDGCDINEAPNDSVVWALHAAISKATGRKS